MKKAEAPIGVFDSGLGGLTVLKEIMELLPGESTIYLGDTARVPYGIRSPEVVIKYSFENTRFLLSLGIKALVIACNTASAVSLDILRDRIPVPLIGVIEPGARAAVKATKSGRIGVIGTEATIRSNAYSEVIRSLDPRVRVFSSPCPLFVPLVEEGWVNNEVARLTAAHYLEALLRKNIDTLLLGCTHYPLLRGIIGQIMGEDVTLIDSGTETAIELRDLLGEKGILSGPGDPIRRFYSTDSPVKFKSLGARFLGDRGRHIKEVRQVEVWDETRWKKK
jgi:glutamate racemase